MEYQTTSLQPFKSYPTYQFHAFTASERLCADDVFKICILETLKWLRSRLRKFSSIPEELNTPEPEDYMNFSEEDIRSFSFISGRVNAVYLKNKGMWAFYIVESDAGVNVGKENQRLPVVGRTFNTEVTYLKHENNVEVGIRTVCSEPYDSEVPCEVFRPMFVKALAMNENVGFILDGFRIDGRPFEIGSRNDIEYFDSIYSDSSLDMPLILIAEAGFEEKKIPEVLHLSVKPELPVRFSGKIRLDKDQSEKTDENKISVDMSKVEIDLTDTFRERKEQERKIKEKILEKVKSEKKESSSAEKNEPKKFPDFPYQKLAQSLMGFEIVCFVTEKGFKLLKNKYGIQIDFGEIIVMSHGKEIERYGYSSYSGKANRFLSCFREQMKLMPKNRQYSFGRTVFYSDARMIELSEKRQVADTFEAKYKIVSQENEELKKQLTELSKQNVNMNQSSEQLRNIQKKLDNAEKEAEGYKLLCEELKEQVKLFEERYKKTSDVVDFYRKKAERATYFPVAKDDVCDWIEKQFSENITLLPRVKAEMRKYDGALDIGILCDGILYLNAYSDFRRGKISSETLSLYAEKNSWDVQSCGGVTLRDRQDDYTAMFEGEKLLFDRHLKYGTYKQTMIRIYFCWSDKMKKVIIGFMPGHLPTATQST